MGHSGNHVQVKELPSLRGTAHSFGHGFVAVRNFLPGRNRVHPACVHEQLSTARLKAAKIVACRCRRTHFFVRLSRVLVEIHRVAVAIGIVKIYSTAAARFLLSPEY